MTLFWPCCLFDSGHMASTWIHREAWFSFFCLFYFGDVAKASGKCFFVWIQTKPCCCPLMQVQRADLGQWGVKWAPHRVLDRDIKVSFGQAVVRAVCAAELSSSHCSPKSAWPRAKDLWGWSSAIKCSKTWKLIFNTAVEMKLSCVAGSGDQVLLVYTPGACCWEEVSMHSAGLGTWSLFLEEKQCGDLRRLQKQGFSKRYRGTLLKQQWGRQLLNWFLSEHLQFPFKVVKLIIYMVDTGCFQTCCFVPSPLFFSFFFPF